MLHEELWRVVALLDATEDEQDLVRVPHGRGRLVGAREDRRLDRSGEVLDLREHHQLLFLGDVLSRARDHARDDDQALFLFLLELGQIGGDDVAHAGGDLLQRMLGQVDAEELLLPGQELLPRRLGAAQRRGNDLGVQSERREQTDLAALAILLLALRGGKHPLKAVELRLPWPERVSRAALDERLEHALVATRQIDASAEIVKGAERTTLPSHFDDPLDRALPDVLHRAEAEADALRCDRESERRLVHIRWQHRDAHTPALRDGDRDTLGRSHLRGEHRRHVLDRVVRLQVGGVVRDHAIDSGVRAVESVARERLEVLPYLLDHVGVQPVAQASLDELHLLRVELLFDLLADRVAEDVGLGHREAGESLRHGHHVLLVDHHAVRGAQNGFERGVRVGDGLFAVLAADVRRDVVHRPGTEERDHGHDVFDAVRLEIADVPPHTRGLELEHAGRLTRAQQIERLLVVERDLLAHDAHAARFVDQSERLVEDREVAEPEEVELQNAKLVERLVLVLALDRFGLALRAFQRDEVGQRLPRDHHSGGMRAGRADETLDLLREIQQPLNAGVTLHISQLRDHPARFLEVDAERDDLRHAVGFAVRHPQHARDVTDRGARQHRVERGDLGDAVRAVLLRDIGDHLVAAVVHEVHVDVRRRVALEVEESIEDEPVLDRVDVREVDGVVHQRSAGATAHGGEDVVLVRVRDEVLHDEDVARVAGLADDVDLAVDPRLQLRRHRAVPLNDALLRHLPQLLLGCHSLCDLEVRHLHFAQRQPDVDHRRDLHGVLQRLDVLGEQRIHLFRALQVQLGVIDHLEAILRVDGLALLDAHHDVLRLGILGMHVMQVVGHDHRDPRPACDLAHALSLLLLLGDAVVHELEVVVPLAEDLLVLERDLHRRVDALVEDRAPQLALEARRERDEALAVLAQQLLVHARPVVVAVEVRRGHERDEILVADEVLRQENEVERLAVAFDARVSIEAAVARDVRLDADDRLDACLAGLHVEIDRAVQRTVVRERECGHPELFRPSHEVGDAGQPVKQAVLAVRVEMNELLDGDLTCRWRKPRGMDQFRRPVASPSLRSHSR